MGVDKSSNNWEGDKDLDEYFDQNWHKNITSIPAYKRNRNKRIFTIVIFVLTASLLVTAAVLLTSSEGYTPAIQTPDFVKSQSNFDISLIEDYILNMTNQERINNGLISLDRESTLDEIAVKHSQDMIDRDFFDHVNPDGQNPTIRGNLLGYDCTKHFADYSVTGIGENLSLSYTYQSYDDALLFTTYDWHSNEEQIAQEIVTGWMNSYGHRENILDIEYDRIGIGVVISNTEEILATQNFC